MGGDAKRKPRRKTKGAQVLQDTVDTEAIRSELEDFATKKLGMSEPLDFLTWTCIFNLFKCPSCGVQAFRLIIEVQPQQKKTSDFCGNILARCRKCGTQRRIFSAVRVPLDILEQHVAAGAGSKVSDKDRHEALLKLLRQRQKWIEKTPKCRCGCSTYYVLECERWEPGPFADDGIVVGKCSGCGRKRKFFWYD